MISYYLNIRLRYVDNILMSSDNKFDKGILLNKKEWIR